MATEDQINKNLTELARKMGHKNASILLSNLGKDKQFVNALDTPIGQELLKNAVMEMERITGLILSEKEDKKDRAELQAYLAITRKWSGYINQYNKDQEKFNKNVV
jgi:tRNA U34 5-carboxymethylaminomethyl modifying enzyme MnmG/GidA